MKTTAFLKKIVLWHKQLVLDLSQQKSQLDQQALQQVAQAVIHQCVTQQICADRRISFHPSIMQPTLNVNSIGFNSEQLQLAMQHLAALKHSCQISVFPIELLGQIHERLLSTHQSQTRKAQGVYYTPAAIVEYIVNTTIGSPLQNKTVEDLSCNPLRILDPACGSGAFLLRAYQQLLGWYHTQYLSRFKDYRNQLYQHHNGEWYLTIAAKQQILLQHIFGLDISAFAVEVTKQSLWLQMLEDSIEENQIRSQGNCLELAIELSIEPANEPAILQHNIQCGNALVDLDFYQLNQQIQFTDASTKEINGFSWKEAFPEAIQSGGFEIIIGNPPWLFTRTARFNDEVKRYYQTKYFSQLGSAQLGKAKQTGKVNLFVLFLLKCVELVHSNGQIALVVPNTLLRTTVYERVRKYILDHCSIEQIVDLGRDAFSGVTASSAILILGKNSKRSTVKFVHTIKSNNVANPVNLLSKNDFLQNTSYVFSTFLDQNQNQLFQKINSVAIPLKNLTSEIIEGIVCRKDQIKPHRETDRYQKLLEGKDINRYCISFREKYVLFDRQQLHRPRPDHVWNAKEKIILRRIAGGEFALIAALDVEGYYAFASTNNILLKDNLPYDIRYILALLNSRLLNCYYIQKYTNRSSLTVNISKTFLEQLPIRSIDFDCPVEQFLHDRLVAQVDSLQTLYRQHAVETAVAQRDLQQQIQHLDQQIDQWVYELYNLTDSEIDLIKTPAVGQVSHKFKN